VSARYRDFFLFDQRAATADAHGHAAPRPTRLPFGPHFASWFVMRGGSLQALQRILGHASLTMTQRYAHLSPDYLRSEVARTERRPERRAEPASDSTQGSTQEAAQQVGVSQKSLQ
jgi:site-specific recombinase XerC